MENDEQDFQEEATSQEDITSDNSIDNGENDSTSESDGEEEETYTFTKAELEERDKLTKKEQDKRWKERFKKATGEESGEEGGQESKENRQEVGSDERYERLELKTEGIKNKEQQDFILDYAKFKGIPVSEALNNSIVKAELKEMETAQRVNDAMPHNSKRSTSSNKDDLKYLVKQFEKGKLPDNPKDRKRLLKHLSD